MRRRDHDQPTSSRVMPMQANNHPWLRPAPAGIELDVKVVPGASRDRIAGILGKALKLQVAAPPERGKANAAVTALLSRTLRVPHKSVTVIRGTTSPHKTIHILGLSVPAAQQLLKAAGHL